MPRRPSPLPETLGQEFSVRAAVEDGVARRRLRGSDLDVPFRGARARPRPPETTPPHDASPLAIEAKGLRAQIVRLAAAFATIAPPGWFFSHVTAAVLWGLPLPLRVLRAVIHETKVDAATTLPPRGLDVAVLGRRRGSKATGLRGHQLKATMASVRTHDGRQVADPATTWVLLAEVLTVDELVKVGDAIVNIPRKKGMKRGSPSDALATIEQLEAAMLAGRRRGIAKLREALRLIRVGSASPGETDIRLACGRAGLPEPELDVDVFGPDGEPVGYTEIAYPDYRLLIEYEGDHHRVDRDQWNRDIEKHAACAAAGQTVLRLTSRHVYPNADPAVVRIREALLRAGWTP